MIKVSVQFLRFLMFTLRFSHVRDLPTFVWPNEGTSCSSKRSKIDQKNENTPAEQMPLLKQQEEVTWKKKKHTQSMPSFFIQQVLSKCSGSLQRVLECRGDCICRTWILSGFKTFQDISKIHGSGDLNLNENGNDQLHRMCFQSEIWCICPQQGGTTGITRHVIGPPSQP